MGRLILVVNGNKEECQKLCAVLKTNQYRTMTSHSLGDMEKTIGEGACHAVILDLDSLPVDNRFIKGLRSQNPGLCIVVLSDRPFHPELGEAISTHIYACISKPVDPEELLYILRSTCV